MNKNSPFLTDTKMKMKMKIYFKFAPKSQMGMKIYGASQSVKIVWTRESFVRNLCVLYFFVVIF